MTGAYGFGEGGLEGLDGGAGGQPVAGQNRIDGGPVVVVDQMPAIGQERPVAEGQDASSASSLRRPASSSQSVLLSLVNLKPGATGSASACRCEPSDHQAKAGSMI